MPGPSDTLRLSLPLCEKRSRWVSSAASAQQTPKDAGADSACRTAARRSHGPAPTRCHWTSHASVSHSCPMRREPALVAGRWRPARGHRRARGTPARGWPGNALHSRLRPLPAAARRGAGGPAGGRRAAGGAGERAEGAKPAGGCAPPVVRSRPRAGAAARVVRNEGAAARARRPAPPHPEQLGRCTVRRPGGK